MDGMERTNESTYSIAWNLVRHFTVPAWFNCKYYTCAFSLLDSTMTWYWYCEYLVIAFPFRVVHPSVTIFVGPMSVSLCPPFRCSVLKLIARVCWHHRYR
jgi:hypothetical protein